MIPNRETLDAYRALVEAADDVILIADWDTVQFVDANQVAIDKLGYSLEELLEMTPRDLSQFPKEEHGRLSSELRDSGQTRAQAVPIRCKDGTIIPMDLWVLRYVADDNAYHVNVLRECNRATPMDADAFRAARGGLLVSEAFYRGVVTCTEDAVVISDAETGRCVEANPAACALFGFVAEQWPDVTRAMLHDVTTDRAHGAAMTRRDGTSFVADVMQNEFEAGGRRLVVSVIRDVTERHRQAQALKEAQAKVMHTQKLAALGEVAAGVAHEINNPAAFIAMNYRELVTHVDATAKLIGELEELAKRDDAVSAILKRHVIDAAAMRSIVDDNLHGVERIQSVTRDLRMFSRLDCDDVERVDLNAVVRGTVNLLANELRHRARVKLELASDLPSVVAERGKIAQVLMNLLLNASQSIEEGVADDNEIRIITQGDGEDILVIVEDTGAGIPDEQLPRIFDPFYTTKPREQGVGLGLSLCVDILARHRGGITATSTPGSGTRFEVRIPSHTGLVERAPSVHPRSPSRQPPRSQRILVIDDDPQMARAYERMLRDYDASVVTQGARAIDLLRQGAEFDLIICDLMMPDMDGPRVYDAISELSPTHLARILFCTGGAFTPRVREFLSRVENRVIDKPLQLDILESILDPN